MAQDGVPRRLAERFAQRRGAVGAA